MALTDYTPTLQWYADALTDLDGPTGATKSNPGALTDPTIAGSPDAYAAFTGAEGVMFAPTSPVNNVGTGPLTIVAKIRMPTASAGEVIAENWDGSGANDSDVGWQLVRTTGTSRRIGLALPPTAYTTERIETPANATTNGQDFIVAFRRDGTTWTVWLDDDAAGGMSQQTPGTNNLPGNAGFSSCGDIAIGSTRAGGSTFGNALGGGRVYWLVAFDAAISDADLELAAWDTESNLKAAWLGPDGIEAVAADTLTLSDAAVSATERLSVAADTITLSDAAVSATERLSVAADTITLSDSGVSAAERVSAAADTVTLSDSGAAEVTTDLAVTAADTVTLSDSGVSVTERLSVAVDTLTLSDSGASVTERLSVAVDTVTLSDSAVGEATTDAVASAADTLTLSDVAASVTQRLSIAVDALTLSDSAASGVELPATAADTITLSDSAVGAAFAFAVAEAADTVTLSDSAVAVPAYAGVAVDTLTLSDSAASTTERLSVAEDSLTFSDSAIGAFERLLQAEDSITFSDSALALNTTFLANLAEIKFSLRSRTMTFAAAGRSM